MLQIVLQPVEKKANCTKPEPDYNEDNSYFFGSDNSAWEKETKSQSVYWGTPPVTRPNIWDKQVREIEWGHWTLDFMTF